MRYRCRCSCVFCEGKRKRSFVKVKRLVRPLGDHPQVRKRAEAVIQRNLQKADFIRKLKQ